MRKSGREFDWRERVAAGVAAAFLEGKGWTYCVSAEYWRGRTLENFNSAVIVSEGELRQLRLGCSGKGCGVRGGGGGVGGVTSGFVLQNGHNLSKLPTIMGRPIVKHCFVAALDHRRRALCACQYMGLAGRPAAQLTCARNAATVCIVAHVSDSRQ